MELLLGEAQRRGCDLLISMGALGSNQILSSVIFGRKLGFDIEGLYFEQPLHGYVKRHLLVGSKLGTKMLFSPRPGLTPLYAMYRWLRGRATGRKPYFIPTFGSHPLCVLGYVNAGIELIRQVETGSCPMPDVIYVTLGTGGTHAGILLALRLSGISTRVVGVRITDKIVCNGHILANLLNRTVSFMRRNGADAPELRFKAADMEIEHAFFGGEYARSTPEAEEAIRMVRDEIGLMLDSTYTGKTFAALLKHAEDGKLTDQKVLYWHTLNGCDLRPLIEGLTIECLPHPIRDYACRCEGDECDVIGF
jgi:D-cysteine desulfhydrase